MHVTALSSLVVSLLAVAKVQASVTMNLYSDGNCQTQFGTTTVNSGTCDENVTPGWSSAMITNNDGSPAGTLTFYTNNNCAAAQPSHGYSSANFACLEAFGFVANAVGLAG